jgi:membrane protein DedA with SNARE-associated domain
MLSGILEPLRSVVAAAHQGNAAALGALFIFLGLGEAGISFPLLIPGILCAAGFAISRGTASTMGIVLLFAALILGREAGAGAIYWGSRLLGDRFLRWMGRRSERVRAGQERLAAGILRRAPRTVAFGRLTPGLLVPTTLLSGALRIPFRYFAAGVALASVLWDGMFLAIGAAAGEGCKGSGLTAGEAALPTIGILGMLLLWFALRRLRGHRRVPPERRLLTGAVGALLPQAGAGGVMAGAGRTAPYAGAFFPHETRPR